MKHTKFTKKTQKLIILNHLKSFILLITILLMDPLKEAFHNVKKDISSIHYELNQLKEELNEIKEILSQIQEKFINNPSAPTSTNILNSHTNHSTTPTHNY